MILSQSEARGRIDTGDPVAIVDIGSNSVRLVAYEGRTRSPTPIFNEKAFCGLGRGVLTTGALNADAMTRAIAALARFRTLCRTMRVRDIQVVATAAARDARNGADFLAQRRADDRRADHAAVGPQGGRTVRARRRLLDARAGWRRRRPRRRLARSDRRQRPRDRPGADAAARRPRADGRLRQIAEAGDEDRARGDRRRRAAEETVGPHVLRSRRHVARAGAPAHAPAQLSAQRHAQLRDPGARRRGFRIADRARRHRLAQRHRTRFPRSAGRCSPMARSCSRKSFVAPSRSPWSCRRPACAKGCFTNN